MKRTHIRVFKKIIYETRIKCFLFTSRYPVLSFDVLYVQIFIQQNVYLNRDKVVCKVHLKKTYEYTCCINY